MSEETIDDLIEQESPVIQKALTEFREDLIPYIDTMEEVAEALAISVSGQDTMIHTLAAQLIDNVHSLKMVIQESDSSNRRRHMRVPLEIVAACRIEGTSHAGTIMNMSVSGAAIHPRLELDTGSEFELHIPEVGDLACEVMSLSDSLTHVRFVEVDGAVLKSIGNLLQERVTPVPEEDAA